MVGYLYCALAMVTVGSTVVASKVIAAGLPPFTATALRFVVALPVFLALCWLMRARWPRIGRRDAALLALQAGAGSVGYTVLLISGMSFTSAATAGVLVGTLPIVTAAFAVLGLGERPTLRLLGAIALAALGVLVASGVGLPSAGAEGGAAPGVASESGRLFGAALVLAAVACESFFILLNKRLHAPIEALPLSTLMCALGLLFAGGAALAIEQPWQVSISAGALQAVLYYALVPTVLGFVLWYAGAARISGAEAALFTALSPISATLLANTILHEAITPPQLAGMACVLAAVASLAWKRAPYGRVETL
ncbi:EamA domain-containing membrane protein RarD [Duganella sp. CF458]|uniref:DMT family transporter n=1 Tax=Duganella sp. CF458 TaxID=1884368 RepID=UPI0008E75810|nr:DMT family transporter [Duganella sp. CF458]SFG36803.1 EamA domain-containing membrane protein RarD [Duganella sp. CF458]